MTNIAVYMFSPLYDRYRHIKKFNDNSKYLHRDHPIKIIESVPGTVAHRINMFCSSNEIFTNVKRDYENKLKSNQTNFEKEESM